MPLSFKLPSMLRKSSSSQTPYTSSNHSGEFVTVGYFPNWSIYQKGYKPADVPTTHLTHILYAFANIEPETGSVVLSDAWADQQIKHEGEQEASGTMLYGNLHQFLLQKRSHRQLKTLLSIGGWSYSSNFRGMHDAAKRQTFAQSAVKLLADHGFDGLDSA